MGVLWLLSCLSLLLSSASFAAGNESDPRPDMHLILDDVRALEKYLVSKADYLAKENEKSIPESLEKLNHHLKGLAEKKKIFQSGPALRTNLEMATSHMANTEQYFKESNKQLSRYMLQSGIQMCIGCHTPDQASDLFVDSSIKKSESMDYGNYLLATPQFAKRKDVPQYMQSEVRCG